MGDINKIFGIKEVAFTKFVSPERQSVEQTEDYAVKQVINAKETNVETLKISGAATTTYDNSTADLAYIPMVLYNTDATPPAANTVPIGTIYIQYTP